MLFVPVIRICFSKDHINEEKAAEQGQGRNFIMGFVILPSNFAVFEMSGILLFNAIVAPSVLVLLLDE